MSELLELIESAEALASLLIRSSIRVDEKGEAYYYDEAEEKRWVLGDGGDGGNCDACEDSADEGWVDMDFTYTAFDEECDEPPGHPNDTCTIENRTRRFRVYDDGEEDE